MAVGICGIGQGTERFRSLSEGDAGQVPRIVGIGGQDPVGEGDAQQVARGARGLRRPRRAVRGCDHRPGRADRPARRRRRARDGVQGLGGAGGER